MLALPQFRVLRADVEALFQIDLTAHRTKEALLLSPLHIARSVFHKDLVYVQYLFRIMTNNVVISIQSVYYTISIDNQFKRFKKNALSAGLWANKNCQITKIDRIIFNWTEVLDNKSFHVINIWVTKLQLFRVIIATPHKKFILFGIFPHIFDPYSKLDLIDY